MKAAVCFFASALLASAVPWAYSQAGNQADLQQKLNSSFKITTTTANMADIAAAGDVVELHKDGMRMSALSTVLTESNTYKGGKIGGGDAKRAWGSFGTAMLSGMAAGMDSSGMTAVSTGPPPHILAAGDKCWILSITVQKDGVQFKLYTDPDDNGVRYRGDLKFPFANKKQMPSADELLATIAEVLTVVPPGDQGAQPAQDGPYAAVAGEYLYEQLGYRYILHPDGTCIVRVPGTGQSPCDFTVDGDWIRMIAKIGNFKTSIGNIKIQGDKLYLSGVIELIRQGGPPAPAPEQEAAAPPAPPQRQYDELAPPPPPPAPAPVVSIGELKAQVVTDFGEPQRKAVNGPKEIYFYTDLKMKVTFTNGKVSGID